MKGHTAAIITALSFATIGVLVKLIGSDVPIMTVSFLRVFIGFTVLAPFFYFFLDKNVFKVKRRDLLSYAIIGLLIALAIAVYQIAMTMVPVANVVLLDSSWMIFAAIFAYIFLKETLDKKDILVIALAFIGIWVMNPFTGAFETGNILALSEGFVYAILLVFMRYEGREHSLSAVFWFLLFATIFLSPFPLIYGFGNAMANMHWLLILGIVPGALGYLCLTYALKKTKTERVGIIINVSSPLFAILLAVILVSDIVETNMILGGAILLFAGVLLTLNFRAPKPHHTHMR